MHQCRVFRVDTSRTVDKTEWTQRGEVGFTTLETHLINGVDVAQSNSPFVVSIFWIHDAPACLTTATL